MGTVKSISGGTEKIEKPSRKDAEEAVKTLLRWIGEDPERNGLLDTPARVIRSYDEFFAGYKEDPQEILSKTFDDIEDYNDFVLVKNIDFVSHCEHHMVPIVGQAHVAYWPENRIVGISKLARVVDIFGKRLVSQENMTKEICNAIDEALKPRGTAVLIDAVHHCMSSRGVMKGGSSTVTSRFTGIFQHDESVRKRFLDYCPS